MSVDLANLRNLAEAARAKAQKSRQQRDGRTWYRIENATAADRAEIYLYDMIGEWGVTADDFVSELRGVTAEAIDLHLNCEGGEVFDALAIYAALVAHPAHVTAHVDSLAASAASFIVQAADHRVMAKRARMMIHKAQGLCIGDDDDMEETRALLLDLSGNIADIYAERAGGTRADWLKAMKPGGSSNATWYSADAAVAAGLADEVAGTGGQPQNASIVAAAATDIDVSTHVPEFDFAGFQDTLKGVFQ